MALTPVSQAVSEKQNDDDAVAALSLKPAPRRRPPTLAHLPSSISPLQILGVAATTSSQGNIPTTVSHLWAPSAFQSGPRLPAFYPRANSRPDQSEPWPTPARSPSSQAYPQPVLPCHPHACSQILTFRPLPIKPHVIFIGKGRFYLYLCHACICGTACHACIACKYKYPRHPPRGTGDIS